MTERQALVAHCQHVLATHAKTFAFAGRLLTRRQRQTAAIVYAFCRYADDAVDEVASPAVAQRAVAELRAQLAGTAAPPPLVALYLETAQRLGIAAAVATDLIDGMASDLGPVRIADDGALLRYCYRAAGTVGLMMCGVLEVRDRAAFGHAIDLGIAMQLTNICRDVAEDAGRDRVYLPADRLHGYGATHAAVLAGTAGGAERAVVAELLALADLYYASGWAGLHYLPLRARPAIATASRLYRQIGMVLAARGFDARQGRARVTEAGKLAGTAAALAELWRRRAQRQPHDFALHEPLIGIISVS